MKMNGMTKAQAQAHLDAIFATPQKATSAAAFLFADAPPVKVEPIADKVRKPILVTFEVKVADPQRGQTFAPYKVMRVRNGAFGKYAVDKSYGSDYYDAIVKAIAAHGPTL